MLHTTGLTARSRWIPIFSLLVTSLFLARCGDDGGVADDGPYDLIFSGASYDPHEGQQLFVAVVDVAAGTIVAAEQATVTGGSFDFTWIDLLEKGRDYRLDFFADLNQDGDCNPAPEDHVWSTSISAASGDQDVEVTHNTDFSPAACSTFSQASVFYDLTFNGAGYAPHNGQTLYVAVVDASDDSVLARDSVALASGEFSFYWPNILVEGGSFRIDYYADVDADGACADPDHIWSRELSMVSDDEAVVVEHDAIFTPAACDSF
ncbi:MAG: hypothetical protein ABI333_04735 [bacterium]